MIVAAIVCLILAVSILVLQHPKFGKLPSRVRLKLIRNSIHYKNGAFNNLEHTPMMTGGANYAKAAWVFLFGKSKRATPESKIPSVKIDLHLLDLHDDLLVWFGHSSYFLQVDGKRFLVDPVLSGSASPFAFTTPSHPGTDVYRPEDFPKIDYLLLTHDHWDHLDYKTITALQSKVKCVITTLGNGEHLEHWGYSKEMIVEKDWYDTVSLDATTEITLTPARHFSGRLFKRNQVLWTSFVLKTKNKKIFLGGDSGYGGHFKAIGEQYGPFDLVILECGQYNEFWNAIHMMPEQTVQASVDLKGAVLFPVHWGKFTLSLHTWDEPIIRALAEAKMKGVAVMHPMIGEKVSLDGLHQPFPKWWETVQ